MLSLLWSQSRALRGKGWNVRAEVSHLAWRRSLSRGGLQGRSFGDVPQVTSAYDNIAAGYPPSSCTMRQPRWAGNVNEWRGSQRQRSDALSSPVDPCFTTLKSAHVQQCMNCRWKFVSLHYYALQRGGNVLLFYSCRDLLGQLWR